MQALVIDDSRALRRILADMLRQLGFSEIGEAANGSEGLNYLQNSITPDIVLVDWNMPVMNGLEFVREVRKHEQFASLPLMMVTTETEMEQMASALEAGANEYVMKPFTKEVIGEKLSMLGILC